MPKSSLKKWFYPFYKNAPPYYKKGQSGFFFFNRKEKKKVCAIILSHPTNLNSIQMKTINCWERERERERERVVNVSNFVNMRL